MIATTTTARDPVCGMDVDEQSAGGRTEHNGQTYYFCGSTCKQKFDLDPAQYIVKAIPGGAR